LSDSRIKVVSRITVGKRREVERPKHVRGDDHHHQRHRDVEREQQVQRQRRQRQHHHRQHEDDEQRREQRLDRRGVRAEQALHGLEQGIH
jgi:hypothetical protein